MAVHVQAMQGLHGDAPHLRLIHSFSARLRQAEQLSAVALSRERHHNSYPRNVSGESLNRHLYSYIEYITWRRMDRT